MKLMRTEESLLTIKGVPVEYAAIVAHILVVLVEHIAWSHAIDALLAFLDR